MQSRFISRQAALALAIVLASTLIHAQTQTQSGTLDVTFGTGGKVTSNDFLSGVFAIQQDGKIIAAGGKLARFNFDGTLDNMFGTGGKVAAIGGAFAVALQTDGKIVTAGSVENS